MSEKDFTLQVVQDVRYYSCRAFDEIPGLRHGFSTRSGGRHSGRSFNLSETSWDSAVRVRENRNRLLTALKLDKAHLITLRQIHSNRTHIIEDISDRWNRPEGDALIAKMENVALAVQVADCVPVLIADPDRFAIAAVHSGWRGTLGGILFQTIRMMQQALGSDPARLLIATGPGIRSCCFEVGPEVAVLFDERYPGCSLTEPVRGRPQKHFLDLFKALDVQMNLAGVPVGNRYDLTACTCCRTDEFFSYRAEGAASGRMMAVIGK
jgi:YfiH family protein